MCLFVSYIILSILFVSFLYLFIFYFIFSFDFFISFLVSSLFPLVFFKGGLIFCFAPYSSSRCKVNEFTILYYNFYNVDLDTHY